MRHSVFLTDKQKKQLEYEVVSQELRTYLTRIIERDESFQRCELFSKNRVINRSRSLSGLSNFVLECDDYGGYEPAVDDWHSGEFELCLRRLDTFHFIELVCEIMEWGWLTPKNVNKSLKKEQASFRFTGIQQNSNIGVDVFSIEKLEKEEAVLGEHQNIRYLVDRMESQLGKDDYSGVLHSSASIFETVAKDILSLPHLQNKTLEGIFKDYKKVSKLPEEILNKILEVYRQRNCSPLAGHGNTKPPNFTKEEAVVLSELTKAFVRIEYTLQSSKI